MAPQHGEVINKVLVHSSLQEVEEEDTLDNMIMKMMNMMNILALLIKEIIIKHRPNTTVKGNTQMTTIRTKMSIINMMVVAAANLEYVSKRKLYQLRVQMKITK